MYLSSSVALLPRLHLVRLHVNALVARNAASGLCALRMRSAPSSAASRCSFCAKLQAPRLSLRMAFKVSLISSSVTPAGARKSGNCGTRTPAGVTLDEINDTLNAIRNESLGAWSLAQKEHLEAALEGAERILSAHSPLAALRATSAFTCNLTKCKRGSKATELLKYMRDVQIKEAEPGLITAHYALERELLMEILRRFDRLYRERKQQAGALDFADLEEFTVL